MESVPRTCPRDPKSLWPPASWGHLWTREPWCSSGLYAEPVGAEGEKRRGLSCRACMGNLLWEDKQNFRGVSILGVSLGRQPGQVSSYQLFGSSSWVSISGLTTEISQTGPREGLRSLGPQLITWPSLSPGGCAKAAEKAPEEAPADAARAADEPQLLHGAGVCKWFNVRMGFGFLSMTARAGVALDPPVDVFVHQVRLILELC